MKKIFTLFLILASFSLHSQDFTITNFDINLIINKDGSFTVEETIDVFFDSKKRGIYRDIDNTYEINNKKKHLGIHDINVSGYEFKVDKDKNKVSVRIGSPDIYLTGNQQYRITYKVQNGIIEYPEHQEFHYDLTGNDWKAAIEKATFTIQLPKSITLSQEDMKITGGKKNQNLNVAFIRQIDSRTIKGETHRVLGKKNGITAAIRLPKKYFEVANNQVEYFDGAESDDSDNGNKPWYMVIPLAIIGWFVSFWRKMRNKGHVPEINEPMAYPPTGLTSAHVGAFVDQTAHTRDIVSLIPYWGSEGFLEMKELGGEVYVYRIKNLPPDYPEYEHLVFEKMFENGESCKISDLKTKFHSTLSKASSMLTNEVRAQEYYDPEYLSIFRGPKMAIFPIVMLAIGLPILMATSLTFLGVGFIGAGIAGLVLSLLPLPLTQKGAQLKSEILSFKEFLKKPDPNRIQQLLQEDEKYFDNMLPFAVAFGLEKGFLKTVEPHMHHLPYWYHTDAMNPSFSHFSKGFQPEVIQSAFSSAPAGSGGSSGGGFSSGSGVGGGGGGSW